MEAIQPACIPVNLCFAANEKYARHLAAALYSVLKNRDTKRLYDVLILHKDISEESEKNSRNGKRRKCFYPFYFDGTI